jgi:hypothetical protein
MRRMRLSYERKLSDALELVICTYQSFYLMLLCLVWDRGRWRFDDIHFCISCVDAITVPERSDTMLLHYLKTTSRLNVI